MAAQNEQTGIPHVIYYMIIIAIIGTLTFVYFHDQVVYVALEFKKFQIEIINITTGKLSYLIEWIERTQLGAVTPDDLFQISEITGSYIKWLILPLSVIFIVFLWMLHPTNKLSQTHNMDTLLDDMKYEFTETQPIVGKSLDKVSIDEGPWRMALTPIEFMKKHNLLLEDKSLNIDVSNQIFIDQLGGIWKGREELTVIEKSIFGILAAFACYDRSIAELVISEVAASSKNEKIDYGPALKLFDKYIDEENIQKVIKYHHYNYTIFSSLLEVARDSGIVTTASFLWLKAQDRTLWYCLNNVGRQAVFVEGAAIRAHWLAEKSLGGPLVMPMIDKASSGLKLVFKTVEI